MAELKISDLLAQLEKLQDHAGKDARVTELMLEISNSLAELLEQQQSQAALLVQALKGLKTDAPAVNMNVQPTPIEVVVQAAAASAEASWTEMHVKVNTDRMGHMESLTLTRIK
jgi:hypothetical protein